MKTDDPGPSSDSNVERMINVLGQAGVMVIYSLSTCQRCIPYFFKFLFYYSLLAFILSMTIR